MVQLTSNQLTIDDSGDPGYPSFGLCWNGCLHFPLQAEGRTMETYVAEHQDKARNALLKSIQAAYSSWCEDLKADQAQFESEKILRLGYPSMRFPDYSLEVDSRSTSSTSNVLILNPPGVILF